MERRVINLKTHLTFLAMPLWGCVHIDPRPGSVCGP